MPDNPFARDGKLSYMQIPALDVERSADFYERVFGWTTRRDGNPDHLSFQDAAGELLGAFVTRRDIAREPGILPYIYVDRFDDAIARIRANGCELAREPYREGDLWVATFRDPAGNVIGIWHMGSR